MSMSEESSDGEGEEVTLWVDEATGYIPIREAAEKNHDAVDAAISDDDIIFPHFQSDESHDAVDAAISGNGSSMDDIYSPPPIPVPIPALCDALALPQDLFLFVEKQTLLDFVNMDFHRQNVSW